MAATLPFSRSIASYIILLAIFLSICLGDQPASLQSDLNLKQKNENGDDPTNTRSKTRSQSAIAAEEEDIVEEPAADTQTESDVDSIGTDSADSQLDIDDLPEDPS